MIAKYELMWLTTMVLKEDGVRICLNTKQINKNPQQQQ